MAKKDLEIIVSVFDDEKSADKALDTLTSGRRDNKLGIKNAAVVSKNNKGKVKIDELDEKGLVGSAATGAAAGAALGAVTSASAGKAAAAGAAAAGAVGMLRDSGFDDKQLKRLGGEMENDSSSLVVSLEATSTQAVTGTLQKAGGFVVSGDSATEIAAKLQAGQAADSSGTALQGGAPAPGKAKIAAVKRGLTK